MGSWLYILLFIGGAQGLFLTTGLLSVRRGNKKANRILAILLFLFSVLILVHALVPFNDNPHSPDKHRGFGYAIVFLVPPLLFFYSKALTRPDFKFRPLDSLHLFPSLLFISTIIFFRNIPYFMANSHSMRVSIHVMIVVQMIIYLILMLHILKKYTISIQDSYSSIEKINLHWLRFFIISQTVIWPLALFLDLYFRDMQENDLVWLLVSIFIYLIGYFGFRQPEIFSGGLPGDQIPAQNERKKYEKSALSPEQSEAIHQRLISYMETSKPFIIPSLTLPVLSKEMNISPHHLSQVINERLSKNFFEFINEFRVEEAKRLLKDPKKRHLTLAAIGFESGFNSVSSFNSLFKRNTSLTPSQYQAHQNKTSER